MSNLDRLRNQDVELFPTAPAAGQLSQRDELALAREQARLARELMDYRRQQAADGLARMALGIGAAFIGGFVLLIGLAVLVQATKPAPPPPPPDIKCPWIGSCNL